jgi:hypothetical protein
VIYRDIEKTLNLICMQVNRDHAIRSGNRDEISYQLGRNGYSGLILLVTASISIIGYHAINPMGRSSLQSVNYYQQIHEIVINRITGGLDDVDICPTNIVVYLYEGFIVGKFEQINIAERDAGMTGHFLCQWAICVSCDNL